MQGIRAIREEMAFSTVVLPTGPKDEFIVEFFSYTPTWENSVAPVKVTTNFDELICFFEELEEV
ncbi:hypothetical protein AM500_11485 [Bacillus sp. FJAT-18017]|uniref:hypothetical protein n=1 Tax=Bacillus sp. FJAT-18017 TaxID=1705566 RepID=UPI0006AE74E1|nr:hypothetical protein [Bacillus sp. FJAT-18017]ALC90336.1 hypothetical protein AM500_11485 [Bacillus sp. FJAT-18017]